MLLIADTSPIISLMLIKKLYVLEQLFSGYLIPQAVWEELSNNAEIKVFQKELSNLSKKTKQIKYYFSLSGIEIGETEAIILYKELKADYLLVDDKKARQTAEILDIKCIGALGVLFKAKQKAVINELRPLFQLLLNKNRYYSKHYLNFFLTQSGEPVI